MGGLPANRTVNGFAANPADPKIMFAALRDGMIRPPFRLAEFGREARETAGKVAS